ncbi:deoxyribonuclease IV [Glycomyces algeriensis]|uniref:Probable endonuclease 4 n=1 Tax=Glycomyces algeriensis TaxID=256037 RepID=A0A9W6GAC5_9ACTN|nr:deoxyribonuclease IV [Glycomyces algeriensis]MDA1364364.1 deoxyribonuclease IV [Glycomyces algeriensis]MDR7350397.1 deoxyribonuclease-4 [Glycomyces algeriensis]GLI43103.1 putative endonuclease 4 [Glycomyces algeriensis]
MGSVESAVGHPVGAHVPVAGGLVKRGIPNAVAFEVEALQVFIGSPRGWAPPRLDQDVADDFREQCAARGWPVYVHAAYLLNLASPVAETVNRSVENLRVAMASAERIGAAGVVVHAGSSIDGDRAAALKRLAPAFRAVLDDAPPSVRLLVEPTAGGANSMASTLVSAGEYLQAVGIAEVGLCLDTCHMHAAGELLSDRDGFEASLEALSAAAGPGRVGLVHYNDSKDPRDSRRDRHEALGEGLLGDDGLRAVAASPALAGIPLIVETATQARDVAHAKRLVSEAASGR